MTRRFAFLCLAPLMMAACTQPVSKAPIKDPYADLRPTPAPTRPAPVAPQVDPADFKRVGDTVLFDAEQTGLNGTARGILTAQAAWLSKHAGFTATVQGHADEQGTREYNLALGARRAASVREYLVSQGIAQGRVRTMSFGKERPAAVCSTEDCLIQNRRAVTVVQRGAAI